MKDTSMIRRANMRYTFEDPEEFLERAPSNMQAAHWLDMRQKAALDALSARRYDEQAAPLLALAILGLAAMILGMFVVVI
ncbi:MAG: hypothetical protein HRU31_09805 [Rhodobacteraceae bacterium]|nr:hypothetical protein [Paracoccaceae bacterium]